jgi:hypothetical protein
MKVAALILTMFLAAVSAAGQEALAQRKIISKKEYLPAMQYPGIYPLKLSRSVGLVEFMSNGAVIESVITMQESILPNRERQVVRVTKGNKIARRSRANSFHVRKQPDHIRPTHTIRQVSRSRRR